MGDRTRMESISWWIEDDRISFSSLRCEFFSEVFDLGIHEFDICDTISVRIFDAIFARGCYELYGIYFGELIRQEYPDCTCPCIEIKEYSSLVLYRVDHSTIELLRSESIDLEERLRLDLECESEELIRDRRCSIEEHLIPLYDIGSTRILEEVD